MKIMLFLNFSTLSLIFFRKRMGRNNEKVKDKKKERKMMSERMNVG